MLKGIGVSPGIGYAHALHWQTPAVASPIIKKTAEIEAEIQQLKDALESIREKNKQLKEKITRHFWSSDASIFDAYDLMLSDNDELIEPTVRLIKERGITAEYAVMLRFGEVVRRFLALESDYMRQRAEDIVGLRDQLLRDMAGAPQLKATQLKRPTIIVADYLTPSDLANMDLSRIDGIVCEKNGYHSHVSILARKFGIPAVVAANEARLQINNNTLVGMDGHSGDIWPEPTKPQARIIHGRIKRYAAEQEKVLSYHGSPSLTADGKRIELSADVKRVEDAADAFAADAEAIGVLKTERFANRHTPFVTEETQYNAYRNVLKQAKEKSVTIQTYNGVYDVGAATAPRHTLAKDFRGIRMSLSRQSFFRTQLRAILRASAYGSVRLLLPMVSSVDDVIAAKKAVQAVKDELVREGVPFNTELPVGVAISLPSAALMSDALAPYADFFHITIDSLIDLTLVNTSGQAHITHLNQQLHPAVLRLINTVVKTAKEYDVECSVSGDTPLHNNLLPLLIGMEIDGLALDANFILPTRHELHRHYYDDCKKLLHQTLQAETVQQVQNTMLNF